MAKRLTRTLRALRSRLSVDQLTDCQRLRHRHRIAGRENSAPVNMFFLIRVSGRKCATYRNFEHRPCAYHAGILDGCATEPAKPPAPPSLRTYSGLHDGCEQALVTHQCEQSLCGQAGSCPGYRQARAVHGEQRQRERDRVAQRQWRLAIEPHTSPSDFVGTRRAL